MSLNEKNKTSRHRIEFSLIDSYNYYYVPDNLEGVTDFQCRHVRSGNKFRAEIVSLESNKVSQNIRMYEQTVLYPAVQDFFEWPVDLIVVDEENGRKNYLIFKNRVQEFDSYTPIRNLLYRGKMSKKLDWRNDNIQKLCLEFLRRMCELRKRGYCYLDYGLENIKYSEDTADFYFRFTTEVRPVKATKRWQAVDRDNIGIEFAAPWIYAEDADLQLGEAEDNYSIAVILFRMMYSRLPYQGYAMDDYGQVFDQHTDIEEGTHNYYFEHYHMNPHFIFDPEDDSNRLSSSVDNDLVRERWQETPEVIKNMFIRTFSNASSKSNVTTYSPFKWYETLKECFANSNAAGNQ